MGQNFCQACDHGCPLSNCEGDLSNKNNKQNPLNEHIIYLNNDFEKEKTQNNEKYTSVNSISNNTYSINNNYIFTNARKTAQDYQNDFYQGNIYSNKDYIFNENLIDQKELEKIKYKYKIRLIIKYLKKNLELKKESLPKIVIEENYESLNTSKDNLNNLPPDIDLMPLNNYLYIGNKYNNVKEGYGLEIFQDINARYFGTYVNNKKNGYCKYEVNNEENCFFYYGEVSENQTNGFGYYENLNNNIKYEGEWKNSMRNGIGLELYEDGSLYAGEFFEGKKKGIGFYKWADNSNYEGEWDNNMFNGYGIYFFGDGSQYIGSWYNNKMDGLGEFKYLSKKNYFGYFKDDIRCGFGVLYWIQEKKVFIGFWVNNKQNGLGKFINNDKSIYGKWKDGKLSEKLNEDGFFESLKDKEKIYIPYLEIDNYNDFQEKFWKIMSDMLYE